MASSVPFVSIIVPVYDDMESLTTLLRALGEQDYPQNRFECLVVDNLCHEPIRVPETFDFAVRVFCEPLPGAYAARNRGLQQARGDLLAFTDADCIPRHDWLSSAVRRLQTADQPVVVAGGIDVFCQSEMGGTAFEWHSVVNDLNQARFVTQYHFAATANMITNRKVFDQVGQFNPTLLSGGDLEWGQRAWSIGIDQVYAEEAVVRHPARSSFPSLVSKTRRIAGGHYQFHNGKGDRFLSTVATTLRIACGSLCRSWQDPRLPTLGCRLRVMAIDLALRLIQMGEIVRLRLGGQPTRR
jgi:cellulose synthase/poly-beta-1,6-N-acetylglucosamine synthase-like glycosyltransferase